MKPTQPSATQRLDALYTSLFVSKMQHCPCVDLRCHSSTPRFCIVGTALIIMVHLNPFASIVCRNRKLLRTGVSLNIFFILPLSYSAQERPVYTNGDCGTIHLARTGRNRTHHNRFLESQIRNWHQESIRHLGTCARICGTIAGPALLLALSPFLGPTPARE